MDRKIPAFYRFFFDGFLKTAFYVSSRKFWQNVNLLKNLFSSFSDVDRKRFSLLAKDFLAGLWKLHRIVFRKNIFFRNNPFIDQFRALSGKISAFFRIVSDTVFIAAFRVSIGMFWGKPVVFFKKRVFLQSWTLCDNLMAPYWSF